MGNYREAIDENRGEYAAMRQKHLRYKDCNRKNLIGSSR
jgi:hypothetical protein